MPHDVTMPQLGMAQDAGKIVSWLKSPGDAVAKGDALFEVETDKATMEVEAQADGFLTGVAAAEGDDVPVGAVIARISESADDDTPALETEASKPKSDQQSPTDRVTLPEGRSVTMPQLGMSQDTGQIVNWLKAPGEAVSADDVLFEVETDKSTVEVPAGADGYLAATLAEAGEEVPVGDAVAIISAEKPESPVARSVKEAASPSNGTKADTPPTPNPTAKVEKAKPVPRGPGDRILASPKARRLALEQGLDLARLAKAGHPQPYHVRDLETLRALASEEIEPAAAATRHITAEIETDGLTGFTEWAERAHDLSDADAILAGLAGASLARRCTVAVSRFGAQRSYAVPAGRALSAISQTDEEPDLVVRDLRGTTVRSIVNGAESTPVLTLARSGSGLSLTLECSAAHMDADAAIALLTEFAGRLEDPLRHLL